MKKIDKPVLQPTIPAATVTPAPIDPITADTHCIVCKVDTSGNEVMNTEFETSIRMWDRVYSKNNIFKLKKK